MNTSFRAAPWADVLYACDNTWWQEYFPEVATGFKGAELWTVAPGARNAFKISWVHGAKMRGLSRKPGEINTGMNSGYQAIGLAHMWGAKKILLLGYDMQRTGGRVHWHADHPRKLGNGGRFSDWAVEMGYLASDALKIGVEIINCSRQTALRCFPRSTIQEQLP